MPRWIHAFATAEAAAADGLPAGVPPGVLAASLRTAVGRAGLVLTVPVLAAALVGPWLAPVDPFAVAGPSLAAPSWAHPFGTDALGRDVLSGVLYGARTSVLVAVGVGVLAFLMGVVTGAVAGYAGGRVDDLMMRVTEFFQVLPRFFLAIVAIAMLGPGLDRIVLVLGLTSWPVLARVVRAEILSLERLEFVRAAEASGATPARILVRELLPNALPPALVMLGILLGQVLLLEAGLGFLGLGDPNALSWGTLAGQAQPFLRTAWWLALFPGLAITLTVLGLNLLGDALTSALGGRR